MWTLSGPQEEREWIPTENMHETKKQHRIGIKIPTIVNGRITHSDCGNPTVAKKKTTHVSGTNFNNLEHKVKIVGDGHLRGTVARINQYTRCKYKRISSHTGKGF
jgi:hypothetical protein